VITVLLVDDHALVRAGLRALIEASSDLVVIEEAADGLQAIEMSRRLRPQVVLMDLSMPGLDGVASTRGILHDRPDAFVVVLTSFSDQDRVREAVAAGARGYLLKDSPPEAVLSAIRSAAAGNAPLDPRAARALLPPASPPVVDSLSSRELDVLRWIMKGSSNRQIGRALGISERTVKVHVGSLFRRIGVADRTSAAMWGRDHLPAAPHSAGS
jgi:DNA-binding NarL/FixJ family response regulator